MSYYILQKGFELCGWKGLPFALRYPNPHFTDFFEEEAYHVVYALDGQHDIDEDALTGNQKKLLDWLKQIKIALPSDGTQRLEPWQEYKSFPAMYKSGVQWSITGRCNYNCRHCFMSAPDYKGEDLTLEQSIHILDELQTCGVRALGITGGEALVNPHFMDIVDAMKARNMAMDTLYSNGELITEELLDALEARNVRPAFHLSFDGVGWHDWLRGVDGAEETVIRAFKLLHERGYQTSTSMCLHKHNIGALKASIDLLAELGLEHIKMNVASPTGRWKNETEHFLTQDEANEAVLAYLPQYVADGMPISVQFCGFLEFDTKKRIVHIPYCKFTGQPGSEEASACGAVRTGMYISPKGKVLPCMTLGGTAIDPLFPSMLEQPLSEILSDSWYRDVCRMKMGEVLDHNDRCRDCEYRLACGAGCRACGCGENSTNYHAIDEETCHFFKAGWYEKARAAIEQYKDSFPPKDENVEQENTPRDWGDVC